MKIDVIQLRGRANHRDAAWAVRQMIQRAEEFGHDIHFPEDVYGSASVARSRNLSLMKVRDDSDFVLFIDDDMIPEPGALNSLIKHDAAVASALCVSRSFPPSLNARLLLDGKFTEIVPEAVIGRVVQGTFAFGFGFVLVKRSFLREIVEYVLSGRDWLQLNINMLNRLNVRSETRERERLRIEAVRREKYAAEKFVPVFQEHLNDDQNLVSEDFHFSLLVMALGVEVVLDASVLVGHMGDFPYTIHHCNINSPTKVKL